MTPEEKARAKAIQILDRHLPNETGFHRMDLRQAITDALTEAASVPKGCVRTDDGVVRRFDTTHYDPANVEREVGLPLLADGSIWFQHEELWAWSYGGDEECNTDYKTLELFYPQLRRGVEWTAIGWVVRWGEGEISLAKCFPTKEAALAAQSAEKVSE